MVDTNGLLVAWLLQNVTGNPVRALTTKVYAGDLPDGFDPEQGPAIQLFTRGGPPAHEEIPIAEPSVQVRVWAAAQDYATARAVYRAIHDWIHGKTMVNLSTAGFVLSCLEETSGQDVTDPETGWATVLTFYKIMARENV